MKNFVIEVVKVIWGNGWSKTGSALAILGATSLLGWIAQFIGGLIGIEVPQPPQWASILVMFTGVLLLMWGLTCHTTEPPPNHNDVKLMESFRGLFTDDLLDFLRNHSFGSPWRRSRLDALAEFAETWRGSRFEFDDSDLNRALVNAKESANALEELIASGSWPDHNNAEIQTVKTDQDYRTGTQAGTHEKIKKMNDAAASLVKDLDTLERAARRKQI